MTVILAPIPYFIDGEGDPLDNGMIYVGTSGMDARSNQIQLYWDEALTIPASQPLRTNIGFPTYQGAASPFYTASTTFSITVLDKNGVAVIPDIDSATLASAEDVALLQETLRYVRTDDYQMKMGYDVANSEAATIMVGGNSAFSGDEGVLQVGGAGPRDGGNGTYLANDGHPNWLVPQTSIAFNPTEFNIYANGNGGVAVADGSTTLVRSTGSSWGSFMVGRYLWFDGVAYTVSSATADSAVVGSAVPAATRCWSYCYTTGSGTCTVASGVVTRVLGDPFIPHTFTTDTFEFWLGSTAYTVTASNGRNSCTISSPPADGSYTYSYRTNINNQVSTLRLQLIAGASEENLTAFAAPYAYVIGAQASGSGKRRSFYITSEGQTVTEFAPVGKFVSLGGPQGNEAIRALWDTTAVNRWDAVGGATGSGPSLRARGTDTNIGLAFDTKGTGAVTFSSGSFGSTEFQVFAGGAASWLAVASAATAPLISANGAAADIDIRFAPKGAGVVWLGAWTSNADAAVNGYVTVKDSSGNVRKLATIA